MQIERRALYNSLRMNWLHDSALKVEPWQVEDYRSLRLDTLFDKLKQKEIFLDRISLLALAENVDTPEELTDDLLADYELDAASQDQVYLVIFELWRRLIPEKPALSIFCDELDHQIHLYDKGESQNPEAIQDALANLQVILDENTDVGVSPLEVFESVGAGCANDVESFLYDFIAEQIDHNNYSYAAELLDGFRNYVRDTRWFEFLNTRLVAVSDPEQANLLIRKLVREAAKEPDLEFNLEILAFMVQAGEHDIFVNLVKQTLGLLELEEDFHDLLNTCADYYRRLDHDHEEHAIHLILNSRSKIPLEGILAPNDPHISQLVKILI